MPARGKWDCRAEKPFLATRKERASPHPLPPPTPAKRTSGMTGVPPLLAAALGPAGSVQACRTRAPPCTGKLCPRRNQSPRREHLPTEGPTLWQVHLYLPSQRPPSPTLYILSCCPSLKGRESHSTLSTQSVLGFGTS